MTQSQLKFGDLFAGAGGLSLGFILATHPGIAYEPLFAIDQDANSLCSYSESMKWLSEVASTQLAHRPAIFKRDIEKLNVEALLRLFQIESQELDLLIGGPPCQGYSSANRQSARAKKISQNRLLKIFFDKLEDFMPKMFLVENVQGVKWTEPTPDMQSVHPQLTLFADPTTYTVNNVQGFMIERARAIGYHTWHGVINAVDFGVPQTRYRFFLFGIRSDIARTEDSVNLGRYLDLLKSKSKPVTVGEAINDLPALQNGQRWQGNDYEPADNEFIKLMRQFMKNGELHDHFTANHAEYVIDRYKKIGEGQNWEAIKDMMDNYSKVENTHSNIYRRLKADAPAITISHYRKSMIIHPNQHRGISFREACRLQSFPDWYKFVGGSDQKQQQLANAVPPLLASKIAHAIASNWLAVSSDTSS